jgi:glutathione synthase/RimK-type ligase-like ATP-grasp enzyme
MSKIKIVHLTGIDDSNKVEILLLSPDPNKLRFRFKGNVHFQPLINPEHFEIYPLTIGGMKMLPLSVPKADILLNGICNSDSNQKSLKAALNVIPILNIPVFNHPESVLKTGRETISALLQGTEGLVVPKTIRVRPGYLSEVVKIIESGEISFPFLFRESGFHVGQAMELISKADDLELLEKFAMDGRDFYMINFVNFRSEDGLFRKYRVIVVGGKAFPRHLIIGSDWNLHFENKKLLMNQSEALIQEEQEFMKNFSSTDQRIYDFLYKKLNLDYFGIDFSYDAQGRMIVFEINSCFKAIGTGDEDEFVNGRKNYHKPYIEQIKKAMESALLEKAAKVRV